MVRRSLALAPLLVYVYMLLWPFEGIHSELYTGGWLSLLPAVSHLFIYSTLISRIEASALLPLYIGAESFELTGPTLRSLFWRKLLKLLVLYVPRALYILSK